MNEKEYFLKRDFLKSLIISIVEKKNLYLEINGSWKYGDFHLSNDCTISYSDLDLQTIETIKKNEMEKELEKEILESTGLTIFVSIHNSNSLNDLSIDNALDLALLEYGYQIQKNNSLQKIYYLKSKFLLYLLRENINERYHSIAERLNDEDIDILVKYKMGIIVGDITINSITNVIEKFLKEKAFYSYYKQVFIMNKPVMLDIEKMKLEILKQTKLDNFLIKNIESKYKSLIK